MTVTTSKAATALRVHDLPASLRYYVDQLGCDLDWHEPAAGLAQVSYAGYRLLLAGPDAGDLAPYLNTVNSIAKEGATIFLNGGKAEELPALQQELHRRGITEARLVERHWGDRSLLAPDPDGYTISFWSTIERTPDETLALYAAGPDALDAALSGVTPEELDRTHEPGEWSIRQIVHHLTDSEATVLARTKFALAEPGRLYHGNPYDPDVWAQGLDYAGREIEPAVALFRAIRAHMTQLVRHLPDAWQRHTVSATGDPFTAGTMIGMLVSHAFEHIEEIRERRGLPETGSSEERSSWQRHHEERSL